MHWIILTPAGLQQNILYYYKYSGKELEFVEYYFYNHWSNQESISWGGLAPVLGDSNSYVGDLTL